MLTPRRHCQFRELLVGCNAGCSTVFRARLIKAGDKKSEVQASC
jgi:hypothetical protein